MGLADTETPESDEKDIKRFFRHRNKLECLSLTSFSGYSNIWGQGKKLHFKGRLFASFINITLV